MLGLLAERLGCQFGALWMVQGEEGVLACAATWRTGSVAQAFEAMSRRWRFSIGVGLPGRVWSSGEPAWLFDFVEESSFPRAAVARREGLHGAVAFPVHRDDTVLGVVELLSEQRRDPDPALLAAVAAVGRHLALHLERRCP
ncbi:MAG: GAF domain-containing protein [Acidimicrobiia bacterium]|nr:GAF domain-containing protein [Acidimicrobiia bacterium]